jgi:hypothetical protein
MALGWYIVPRNTDLVGHPLVLEGAVDMLDYRLHYAVMATEDRLRPARPAVMTPHRGVRRVFRLGGGRNDPRSGSRR